MTQDKSRAAFEAWWSQEGQYVRAGGGDYEKCFAYAAWNFAIAHDRQQSCEPVGWMYEDELPHGYPYDAMYPYSKVDGVRMFPVYAPPPAEHPVLRFMPEILAALKSSAVNVSLVEDIELCIKETP